MATSLEAWRSWTRIGQLVMQAVEDWSVATLTAAHLPMGRGQRRGGKGINTRPGHPQPRFKHLLTLTPDKSSVSVTKLHASSGVIMFIFRCFTPSMAEHNNIVLNKGIYNAL